MKLLKSLLITSLLLTTPAEAARIKELVKIKGVRSNPLLGYGLVVGLPGSGDSRRTLFTNQSLGSLLRRMGVNIPPGDIDVDNTAAVMVTAELPPFGSPGEKVDVIVSAIGDARSLESGTLLLTPLKGADGRIYAVAQGPLTVGGFQANAGRQAQVRRNSPTTGRITDGATIERGVASKFVVENNIVLHLNEADFTTAGRIVAAINKRSPGAAKASTPGSVTVQVPEASKADPVSFLAQLEEIDVAADVRARVVVNERTGTVVVGGLVTLSAAAVAHGNLNVSIQNGFDVFQPAPFARRGQTAVVPNGTAQVEEQNRGLKAIPKTTTVDELIKALNNLGASPRDLIAILQALKASGALRGELKVM